LLFLLPLTIQSSGGFRLLEWLSSEQANYASAPIRPTAWQEANLPRGADWEAHYKQQFSSRHRSRMCNFERQLEKHGPASIEEASDATRRRGILDHMIAEKRQWFSEKGIRKFFAGPEMHAFLHLLVRSPDIGKGPYLRIFALRAGDDIFATNIGAEISGSLLRLDHLHGIRSTAAARTWTTVVFEDRRVPGRRRGQRRSIAPAKTTTH
jgi:CelD/BcsL family acetyltransferase involved in cellulose biosynthesis